jgi:hypothetical protein
MSKINVNTWEPEGSGTTITAGASGDTLAISADSVTGLNVGSDAAGDVLYNDGTDYTRLAKPGTPADEVLTFATGATAPSWVAAGGGGLVALRIYTAASTTWSKSTNDPTKIIVEVIGGAGGSGAGAWTGGTGGASAYANVFLDVSTVDTATVTVGAAGAAGSAGAGGAGGTSKFTYLSGTGSFTEIECVGGNGGGNANHVGGATTALPTGPANGIYIKGSGGSGASSAGHVAHGYGAAESTTTTTSDATGYGAPNCASADPTTGLAGTQGLVLVWEYL